MQPSAQEYFDAGMMHVQAQRYGEAALCFQAAIMRKPDYHQAWANRGNVLHGLGNHFDAILNFNQALSYEQLPEYFNNRGATWMDLGRYEAALADYHKAIERKPEMAEAHANLGNVYKQLGRIAEARQAYVNSIEANPNYVDGHLNKSIMDLELGNLVEGFKGFEMRWHCGQLPPRGLPCPHWEGEDLNGKRLILYAEQGFGDAIQFVRYATEIKKRWPDAIVTVECRLALTRLLRTVEGVDHVISYGDDPGRHDYCCAMISAARVLGTTLETVPATVRYLETDPHRVRVWREALDKDCGHLGAKQLVGICWSGMARPLQPIANAIDQRRSTNLGQWHALGQVPGVLFISLQTGPALSQVKQPPVGMTVADYSEMFDDFADTAALIDCLDLVISVDTAVVHVAAALGKPVWMLSRFDGCWRWLGRRPDSPWYPSLRQFRQPAPGDWESLFAEVAGELGRFVAEHTAYENQAAQAAE